MMNSPPTSALVLFASHVYLSGILLEKRLSRTLIKTAGITYAQSLLLDAANHLGNAGQVEIANHLGLSGASVHRQLVWATREKYVERYINIYYPGGYTIILAEKGHVTCNSAAHTIQHHLSHLLGLTLTHQMQEHQIIIKDLYKQLK